MTRAWLQPLVLALVLAAACAKAHPTAIPCDDTRPCPGGMACVDAICVVPEAGRDAGDGPGGAIDAGATPPGCGDGTCDASETCSTCPADCGVCCGDGVCAASDGEDCASCPADCGACCGNGTCDASETCATCAADCGACCGDGDCTPDQGETCSTCAADCGVCCGDGLCDVAGGESCATCAADCGSCAAVCPNGTCETALGETCGNCAADCGSCCGNATCEGVLGETCSSCAADCPPPAGPGDVAPNGGQVLVGASITFTWSAMCAATLYEVYLDYWNGTIWKHYYTWYSNGPSFTYYPQYRTSYAVQVRATNAAGTGPYSAPSYFTWAPP